MNRSQRRAQMIHGTKLFGGRSAEEIHAKLAFPPGAKCVCGRPPETRCVVMMPLDELRKKDPAVEVLMQLDPQEFMKMLVPLKGSDGKAVPHVRVSTTYACKSCTPSLERAAAKAPSYAVVEFNRGPKPDRLVSGVAGTSHTD